jgi:hypothetical protein
MPTALGLVGIVHEPVGHERQVRLVVDHAVGDRQRRYGGNVQGSFVG